MADRKLSAVTTRTALALTDEVYVIAGGAPYRVALSDLSVDGSFTPTLYGLTTAGTQTYSVQSGIYTRMGKRIDFEIHIALSAYDVLTDGNLSIGGLPYTNNSAPSPCVISFDSNINMPASSIIEGIVVGSSSYIALLSKVVGGGSLSDLNSAVALTNTSQLIVHGSYKIA